MEEKESIRTEETSEDSKKKTSPMEVPHLIHHGKKWKDYLFEFLMLFLAVTAGFFMENQREHYTEKQRVREYARALIQDLERDTVMVQETIGRIENSIKHIDQFVSFVKGKKIEDLRNIDLYRYTIFLDGYRPYTWNRATLDQIKNSGSLRYFNDSTIIRISSYDAFTHHMDEDFIGDQDRSDGSIRKKTELIDLNYPSAFQDSLRSGKDPMPTEEADLTLLTKDIGQIKMLVNQKLIIRFTLIVRSKQELPELIQDAATIIVQLKKEYQINN
jgi:hypothetical protein